MNKVTTAALMGLVAVTVAANASESRWAGFGAASDYIADVQDIWTLPGALTGYKNAAYFEMGTDSYNNDENGNGGVNLTLGSGVLGVWIGRDAYQSDFADMADNSLFNASRVSRYYYNNVLANAASDVGNGDVNYWNTRLGRFLTDLPLYSRLDVLYAWSLSDSLDLGVGVNYASAFRQDQSDESGNSYKATESASNMGFTVGAEMKDVAFMKLLEIGVQLNMAGSGVEGVASNGDSEKAVNTMMMTKVRIGADTAGENGNFGRIELGLRVGSASEKFEHSIAGTADASGTDSQLGYNVGYAMGNANDKGLALVGVKFQGNSIKSEQSDNVDNNIVYDQLSQQVNSMGVVVCAAAEYKVKEWLTARLGVDTTVFGQTSTKYDYVTGYSNDYTWAESDGQPVNFSEGISLNFGNLTIDGVLDQSLLFNGPYALTGNSTNNGLNTQVSATYGW